MKESQKSYKISQMQGLIKKEIEKALSELGVSETSFDVILTELQNGDFASNVALVAGKKLGKNPKEVALELKEKLAGKISGIEKIEVAGAGFLNFFLSTDEILNNLENSVSDGYGKNDLWLGKKVMLEFAQPNPFKPLHIGHVMAITIGESLSRFYENSSAEVKRANYQGDVGRHVACAIYGILHTKKERPGEDASNWKVAEFLGNSYVEGTIGLDDEKSKAEILALNKKIFEKSDKDINELYEWGRQKSLDYFEEVYKKLGSHFDYYFFESEVASEGARIVNENIGKVFEESEGAIVFQGEKYGLHTRVFINSEGLPTYEAKDVGLTQAKLKVEKPDFFIIETGNEQKTYFEVLLKVISLIYPALAGKMRHISHGMMRMPSGKMSSRLGNVITGEFLLAEVENMVAEKMEDRELSGAEKMRIISEVAVGAIKYSILKQSIGKDIHFDFEKSISFEGDSGPYLQYTAVRIKSLLQKAKEASEKVSLENPEEIGMLEREIYRFPEVVKRATIELAPQHLATYLIDLASSYNSYYASHPIIGNEHASYRLYISSAVLNVLERGLWLLGIKVPEKM